MALTDFQMRHMTKWVSLIDLLNPINYTFPLRPAGDIIIVKFYFAGCLNQDKTFLKLSPLAISC